MNYLTKTHRNDPFFGLLNDFFGGISPDRVSFYQGIQSPKMNIIDGENSYEIHVQAPGHKKGDFDINVEGGMITISNSFEESSEDSQKNWTRREFYRSQFSRSFRLPKDVNSDEISAKYEDGILEINIPKSQKESKKTKIEIS